MKKRLLTLSAILIIAINIFGCKKGGSKDPIIGKWKIVEATGTMASLNIGTLYIFKDNETVILKKGLFENPGKYEKQGKTLIIKMGSLTIKAKFKISGNKMIYKMTTSNQVFTMERQ